MKRNSAIGLLLAGLALGLAGCSCGGGGSGDGVKSDVNQQMSDANSIAKQVDGDYKKLTPEQKQIFLKMANGDEKQASSLVHMMAHPPNERYAPKN